MVQGLNFRGVVSSQYTLSASLRIRTALGSATDGSHIGSLHLNSDAVKITLSGSALANQSDESQAQNLIEGAPSTSNRGTLGNILTQLSDVVSRMNELRKSLDSGALSEAQKTATNSEIGNLGNEFQEIVSSKDFQRLIEIGAQVQSSLQSGTGSHELFDALGSERGLLGDDFMALVQHGSLYQLGTLSSGLASISATDILKALSDPAALQSLSDAIASTAKSLDGPGIEQVSKQAAATPIVQTSVEAPQLSESIFAGSGQVALALRSYDSKDLMKAALSGQDLGEIGLLTLVRNPTDEENKSGVRTELP